MTLSPDIARSRTLASLRLVLGGLLLAGLVFGCGGADEPETLPSPVPQITPTVEPPAPAPPALPPPIREVSPTGGRGLVKVIDPGEPDDKPTTLIEASRLAKQRKREQRNVQPVVTINDENLSEFAEGADVIVLESEPAGNIVPPPSDASAATATGDIRDEDYWRNRALELRMSWRQAVDDIQELELESASLRQQFYAEEDPYIRDSQIKPAWDRVLDRLGALRQQAVRYEDELDIFVQEGQRAGALQGWLNQGWELEPSNEERDAIRRVAGEPDTTEVGEPSVIEPVETSASQETGGTGNGG
ncbi:MAG: hypothetical protein AAGE94_10090 [Acidobacteriota bacterium]